MHSQFKEQADFLTVYIKEAHPEDEWQMPSNVDEGVCYRQPKTLDARLAIANDFRERFKYPLPLAVDPMNDTANQAYGAWPERLYVIDGDGKIAYKGGPGPFQYKPQEVRAWLSARFAKPAA